MRRTDADRREVLAAVASVAAAGALAGCQSDREATATGTPTDSATPGADGTPGDDTTPTDEETPADARAVAATDWLPAPTALGDDRYGFGVLEPAALAPHADALGRTYYEKLVGSGDAVELAGLDPASASTHAAVPPVSVFGVPVGPDVAAGPLRDHGFEQTGSRDGFDVWTPADGTDRALAVGDGVLVAGRPYAGATPTAAVEAAVDARAGDVERYAEASAAASELFDRLTGGQIRAGITFDPPSETEAEGGRFAGNTGFGYTLSVDAGETAVRLVLPFESDSRADADAVREWVDSAGPAVTRGLRDDATVEADGAAVVVAGRMDTGELSRTSLGGFFTAATTRRTAEVDAAVLVDDEHAVTVVWSAKGNADYLTVSFQPEDGTSVEKRLDAVGDDATYEGADGETVRVTVVAHAGERTTVVVDRQVEL